MREANREGALTLGDTTDPKLPEKIDVALSAKIEQGTLDLPVLPEVAAEVLASTGREDCDLRALAELVKRDQAMATHFLRVANSPMYLPKTKIVSLQQALARLGMSAVREIALLISVKTRTFQVRGYERQLKEQFRHSLGTALFAQEIARLRRLNVEEAFLSGLLHDVGRPVLLQAIVDLHKELRAPENTAAVEAAARQHHAPVGSALILKWSLPASLADTIRFHHTPELATSDPRGAMTAALADEISHHVLDAGAGDEAALRSHRALDVLNLYPEDVDKLLAMREKILGMVTAVA
jgi:putative nucleotidyltransferase with HDIG domain